MGSGEQEDKIRNIRCHSVAFLRVWSYAWGSLREVCSFSHILQSFPCLSILDSCKWWMIYEDATAGRAISCSYYTPRSPWIMAFSVVRLSLLGFAEKKILANMDWAVRPASYSILRAAAALLIFRASILKNPPLRPHYECHIVLSVFSDSNGRVLVLCPASC